MGVYLIFVTLLPTFSVIQRLTTHVQMYIIITMGFTIRLQQPVQNPAKNNLIFCRIAHL